MENSSLQKLTYTITQIIPIKVKKASHFSTWKLQPFKKFAFPFRLAHGIFIFKIESV